ncbi:MAG: hypothetical protein ACFB50_05155 [Rubrobacteraceae bacterium]
MLFFLAGIGLGMYMATGRNTRELGLLFALWWVPGAAAATGVLMRDLVTFTVGAVCFLVAGAIFVVKSILVRRPRAKRGVPSEDPSQGTSARSSKTAS